MESYGVCPRSFYIPANLLSISATPQGADIYINGKVFGKAPKDLLVQQLPLQVTVRKDGFKAVSKSINKIPEDNAISFHLIQTPTGFLRVKSVGVEIYVDGMRVESGQKVPVPASQEVPVKIVNPFTGQSKQEFHTVKPNQRKSIIMSLPN